MSYPIPIKQEMPSGKIEDLPQKDKFALARALYLDIDAELPRWDQIADKTDLNLNVLMTLSAKEGWESIRASALAARDLGLSDLRMEVVRRVDSVLLKAIEKIVKSGAAAYVDLIDEISNMPTKEKEPVAGLIVPEPAVQLKGGKPPKQPKDGPALLMLKTNMLNQATEGFSSFAIAMRDMGMVLIPDKVSIEDGRGGRFAKSNGGGNMTQINMVLQGGRDNPPPPVNITPRSKKDE